MIKGFAKRHSTIVWFVAGASIVGGVALAASPTPFSAGETLQASKLNANFTALEQRIATLEAQSEPVAAAYYGIAGNFAPTPSGVVIAYATRRLDTHGAYNPGTGVFTVPAGRGGVYAISAALGVGRTGNGSAADTLGLQIKVNGTVVALVYRDAIVTGAANEINAFSHIQSLNAGDQVTVHAVTTMTNSVGFGDAALARFSIARVGH
jgi:hypothetical protein